MKDPNHEVGLQIVLRSPTKYVVYSSSNGEYNCIVAVRLRRLLLYIAESFQLLVSYISREVHAERKHCFRILLPYCNTRAAV